MTVMTRLFRSAAANARAIHTSSVVRPRISPSSLLSRPQQPVSSPSACRTAVKVSAPVSFQSIRCEHTTRAPNPLTEGSTAMTPEEKTRWDARRDEEPQYLIYFTCKPCGHRSAHRLSKHGYHKGTVLIACASCHNKHVISDHLKIFNNQPVSLDQILAETGQKITKGTVKGDMEWWGDEAAESAESSESSESSAELKTEATEATDGAGKLS